MEILERLGSFIAGLDSGAWAAIAAFGALYTAYAANRFQKQAELRQYVPFLLLSNVAVTKIGNAWIVNVGAIRNLGPGHAQRLTAFTRRIGDSMEISGLPEPFLTAGEVLGPIPPRHFPFKKEDEQQAFFLLTIVFSDLRGRRYRVRFQFHAAAMGRVGRDGLIAIVQVVDIEHRKLPKERRQLHLPLWLFRFRLVQRWAMWLETRRAQEKWLEESVIAPGSENRL